ncbi:MAG: hypothetical protein NT028_01235 [candidate division Zixibacteria bacterium]|nr:hypothetical protein [candidate division Zixibacteria bacterium]
MGAFFLLGGTVLFLAGLGCLILVFASVAGRLSTSVSSSVYFRNKGSYRDAILAGAGIALIISSQGFYWFCTEIEKFTPFDESIPEVRIGFLFEEFRTPRMIVQSTDQNLQFGAQMVPLEGDSAMIGVETLTWGRFGRMLGLKDCYHVNGIYYRDTGTMSTPTGYQIPDYALNGGPSGFMSVTGLLSRIVPGDLKFLMSEPFVTTAKAEYFLQVSPTTIYSSRMVDNKPVASYSK